LPSARGQGEPLTGRLSPPAGASFDCLLLPEDEALYVLASDAGYGFVVKGEDLQAKNKAGKALLSLPTGAKVMAPRPLRDPASDLLAAVTSEGRLLVFPVGELPQLAKGKGNKIIGIPGERVASREEYLVDLAVLPHAGWWTGPMGPCRPPPRPWCCRPASVPCRCVPRILITTGASAAGAAAFCRAVSSAWMRCWWKDSESMVPTFRRE
jgi:hypothetical protein